MSPGHQLTSPDGGSMHADAAALNRTPPAAKHKINAVICKDFFSTNYKAWSRGKSPHAAEKSIRR